MVKRNKDKEEIVDVKGASEKLGPELIAAIAEKEWKTAPMPTEEELAQEKHQSPKARNNPNSRQNLIQYKKDKPVEVKEKIVEGLKFKNKREDIDPFDYIILPSSYDRKMLEAFLPNRKILKDVKEEKDFYTILSSYMSDFDLSELNSSDIEDIVSLAVNRVIENRLLELAGEDPNILVDVSTTIEKFRKHTEKVKINLASRRSDRIDPKLKGNFSIVDLVYAYDDKKKDEFNSKIKDYSREESEFLSEKIKKQNK